jgi:hypothetical protein
MARRYRTLAACPERFGLQLCGSQRVEVAEPHANADGFQVQYWRSIMVRECADNHSDADHDMDWKWICRWSNEIGIAKRE